MLPDVSCIRCRKFLLETGNPSFRFQDAAVFIYPLIPLLSGSVDVQVYSLATVARYGLCNGYTR